MNILDYDDVDTFMFVENEYDFYWFWDEDDDDKVCFVFPLDDKNVLYMWFEIEK